MYDHLVSLRAKIEDDPVGTVAKEIESLESQMVKLQAEVELDSNSR